LTPCSANLTGFRIADPEVVLDGSVSTELTLSSVLVRDPFQNQMTVSRPNHLPQRELDSYEVPLLHAHSSQPPQEISYPLWLYYNIERWRLQESLERFFAEIFDNFLLVRLSASVR